MIGSTMHNVRYADQVLWKSSDTRILVMTHLEDMKLNASVRGILPNGLVTVVSVQWFGAAAIELTYKDCGPARLATNCFIATANRGSK